MKTLTILVAPAILIGTAFGQYTITSQQPLGDMPYGLNGPWSVPLPLSVRHNLNHLALNSDTIASYTLQDKTGPWGTCTNPDPGQSGCSYGGWTLDQHTKVNDGNEPFYYEPAGSTDPWYVFTTACDIPGSGAHNPTNIPFQAPNNALFSSGASDFFFNVWEESAHQFFFSYVSSYGGVPDGATIGTCPGTHAGTRTDPCPIQYQHYCGVGDWISDQGIQTGGGDSLGSGGALHIRSNEWTNNVIPHALYLQSSCTVGHTFPSNGNTSDCSNYINGDTGSGHPINHGPNGALYFLDYTDAQIAAMNIPDWQKTALTAMSHYGGYVGDTTGSGCGLCGARAEGPASYDTANIALPEWVYWTGRANSYTVGIAQTSSIGGTTMQASVRLLKLVNQNTGATISVTGPNCPGGTCDITQHIHMADPCVAAGLSGVTSGQFGAPGPCIGKAVVTLAGVGTGNISSTSGNLYCPPQGTYCYDTEENGTSVTLTANAASGSSFAGWSGACSGTGSCTVTVDGTAGQKNVTAIFNSGGVTTYALSVIKSGTGTGTVTSSPAGINCGSTCSASFNSGTSVTLTAAPASGSNFAGWSGACSGTGTCTVTMNSNQSTTATFNTSGSGSGPITFVQQGYNDPQSSTMTAVTVRFPSAERTGDLNVVFVGWNDTTTVVNSVIDSLGNSYSLAVGPTLGTHISQSIYYAKNILGGSSTMTVTFNKAVPSPDIRAVEYGGADKTAPFDVAASAFGTGSGIVATPSFNTSASNDLIAAGGMTGWQFTGPGTGFTERVITIPDNDIVEDQTAGAAGSYTASAIVSSNTQNWVLQAAAFKPAPLTVPPAKPKGVIFQ